MKEFWERGAAESAGKSARKKRKAETPCLAKTNGKEKMVELGDKYVEEAPSSAKGRTTKT